MGKKEQLVSGGRRSRAWTQSEVSLLESHPYFSDWPWLWTYAIPGPTTVARGYDGIAGPGCVHSHVQEGQWGTVTNIHHQNKMEK